MRIKNVRRGLLLVLTVLLVASLALSGCSALSSLTDTATAAKASTTQPAAASQPVFQGDGTIPSQELLSQLYKTIAPSVVDIQVTVEQASQPQVPLPFPFGVPETPNAPARGEGSGWVFDEDGHIVTNNHVVQDATQIIVYFANGQWTEAEIVATDPQADLAVIKVDPPEGVELRPLPLADPASLEVGHWVVAVGTPFGLRNSMTLGIVSAMGRGFPVGEETGARYTLPDVIQTDAAINPGNSGGPLLNLNGEVVGVNFAINSPVRANSGVGFAIPVSIVQKIVPALIEEGRYHYPYLGISGQTVSPELVASEDLPEGVLGAWVAQVVKDGPSDKGGVKAGDIIVAIDNAPVTSFDDLVSYLINNTVPDQEVTLKVIRDGKEKELTVTVGERPLGLPGPTEGQASVTADEAIQIAQDAVRKAGLMDEIDSVQVQPRRVGNARVWVVTLESGNKTATVAVDADTGEIISMSVR